MTTTTTPRPGQVEEKRENRDIVFSGPGEGKGSFHHDGDTAARIFRERKRWVVRANVARQHPRRRSALTIEKKERERLLGDARRKKGLRPPGFHPFNQTTTVREKRKKRKDGPKFSHISLRPM